MPVHPSPAERELAPDLEPGWVSRVRSALVTWYEAGHRPLPWRQHQDPYRVLVSEMMLVQTTVSAATQFFARFVERFPTLEALASAEEVEVVRAWEGLGYYRRARQVHAAARSIVTQHGGIIPDDPQILTRLPGIGRYIAGAVASIAYDRPAAIVEANTQRVLARLIAWKPPLQSTSTVKRLWQAAERLVPPQGAGTFNQALMELGAMVCTARRPTCLLCPLARDCRARSLSIQELVPSRLPRPAPLQATEACAVVIRDARLLLVQRADGGLWEGFWELPTINLSGADPARRGRPQRHASSFAKRLHEITGITVSVGPALKKIKYTVTKHKVTLTAHTASNHGGSPNPGAGYQKADWIAPERLATLPCSSPMRRLLPWAAAIASGQVDRGPLLGLTTASAGA
jgi:A/G-specific adenine glycosylase